MGPGRAGLVWVVRGATWLFAGALFLGLFSDAVLAALDFVGNGEVVLQRGAVGLLGFLEELGDLLASEFHLVNSMAVAHGAVFAGVAEDLGAVDGHGDVANLQDADTGGEFILIDTNLLLISNNRLFFESNFHRYRVRSFLAC